MGVGVGCGVARTGVIRRIVGVGAGCLVWGFTIILKAMLKTISKLTIQMKILCTLPVERLMISLRR